MLKLLLLFRRPYTSRRSVAWNELGQRISNVPQLFSETSLKRRGVSEKERRHREADAGCTRGSSGGSSTLAFYRLLVLRCWYSASFLSVDSLEVEEDFE